MNRRFLVCSVCRYHVKPERLVDGKCVNAARCRSRVSFRERERQALEAK